MTEISVEHCASCSKCFGPLRRVVEGETGNHLQWKVCDFCGAEHGPWPEKQWEEPASEPDVVSGCHHEAHKTGNEKALTSCSSLS